MPAGRRTSPSLALRSGAPWVLVRCLPLTQPDDAAQPRPVAVEPDAAGFVGSPAAASLPVRSACAMQFRESSPDEMQDVLRVHRLAFGRDDEAALVDRLLHDLSAQPVLSVVADMQSQLVGHVLFTALHLADPAGPVDGAILAPLAVLPSRQRAGIGRGLIEYGCKVLAARNVPLVFVLGDPDYYTRSRFGPALPCGLRAPYAIQPEAAWMVRALIPDVLGNVRGTVRCARSLAADQYWRE